jgi:hypothetical protein
MLTIIHGSDITRSRKAFLDEKNKYPDAVQLEADQVNLSDLAQLFQGGGLFGETKHIFIEQYLTKKKKNSDYKAILTYFEKSAAENTIVFWENKELERSTLNELKHATINVFKLPQTLFQLLDAIAPGNNKTIIKLFHETIDTAETEMVFFMLVRQIRILLALSDQTQTAEVIDEVKRLAPWQKTKLEKQAKNFEVSHLLQLYDRLFQIETAQKTGALTQSLICTIDFFLLEV